MPHHVGQWGAPQPPYNTPDKEIKTPTPPQKNTHKQKKERMIFFSDIVFGGLEKIHELYRR